MKPRVPPQDIEAEKALLGAMLLFPDVYDHTRLTITAEDFYRPEHADIYRAVALGGQDIVLCCQKLQAMGKLDSCGGPAYLAALTDIISGPAIASGHAKIIRECAKKRRFISKAMEMVSRCYEGFDFDNMAADFEQEAFALATELSSDEAEHIGPIVREELARIEKIASGDTPPGLMTGFIDLDAMTGGLQPADLIVIAGRPSMGKTAIAMGIGRGIADKGTPVAVFSLEMNKASLGARCISEASGVNSRALRNGWVGEQVKHRVFQSAKYFDSLPMYIDDTPALHISEMRSRARRLHRKHGIGLVIMDYIQLARGDGGNREQEISDISRGMKAMAKELNIPVIALAQLSRKCEERADKRPLLSDIRESGAIEQDSDVICFVYRDEVYNKSEGNPKKGTAEIIIGKQRNGPTGTVELLFKGETSSFHNLSRYEEQHG